MLKPQVVIRFTEEGAWRAISVLLLSELSRRRNAHVRVSIVVVRSSSRTPRHSLCRVLWIDSYSLVEGRGTRLTRHGVYLLARCVGRLAVAVLSSIPTHLDRIRREQSSKRRTKSFNAARDHLIRFITATSWVATYFRSSGQIREAAQGSLLSLYMYGFDGQLLSMTLILPRAHEIGLECLSAT